jgi:predicted DNA-binding transcriptional regulator YafY
VTLISPAVVTSDELLRRLQQHIGRDRGVTAAALAKVFDIPPRRVRTLITELRMEGIAVCGTPETGYYIAATPEELEQTCQFLRSRAMHSLTLEARLRQIPLPDLLGQMHLKT